MDVFVISLGGSLIVPDNIDCLFLSNFKKAIDEYLRKNDSRIIFVVGGGITARNYQNALRNLKEDISPEILDLIGIKATRMNAFLINHLFDCNSEVIVDPYDEKIKFEGNALVAAGWKPGFSTDMDTVILAKRFGAKVCINLSNIEVVYDKDPKKFSNAKPIYDITWENFIGNVVGTKWVPGNNYPFDPIASDFAMKNDLSVYCAAGKNIENTINILNGKSFVGTKIHP